MKQKKVIVTNYIKAFILLTICTFFIITNFSISFKRKNTLSLIEDNSDYAYQIDNLIVSDSNLFLSGWFFKLEKSYNKLTGLNNEDDIEIYLAEVNSITDNTNSTFYSNKLDSAKVTRTTRDDVNDYFKCEFDYSNSGFEANIRTTNLDFDKEVYQILIVVDCETRKTIKTQYYISEGKLTQCNPITMMELNVAGTDLEEIVNDGYCLVSRPDYHIAVYQYEWKLYWIADSEYAFNDNFTYMQFQMTTTQFDSLPKYRTEHNWFWSNIGDYFEKHEITDVINCGKYRVSIRDIPNGYSVNIVTLGYYTDSDGWIWYNNIRPHYDFSIIPSVHDYGYIG